MRLWPQEYGFVEILQSFLNLDLCYLDFYLLHELSWLCKFAIERVRYKPVCSIRETRLPIIIIISWWHTTLCFSDILRKLFKSDILETCGWLTPIRTKSRRLTTHWNWKKDLRVRSIELKRRTRNYRCRQKIGVTNESAKVTFFVAKRLTIALCLRQHLSLNYHYYDAKERSWKAL